LNRNVVKLLHYKTGKIILRQRVASAVAHEMAVEWRRRAQCSSPTCTESAGESPPRAAAVIVLTLRTPPFDETLLRSPLVASSQHGRVLGLAKSEQRTFEVVSPAQSAPTE
jgi:hypothetical protein